MVGKIGSLILPHQRWRCRAKIYGYVFI